MKKTITLASIFTILVAITAQIILNPNGLKSAEALTAPGFMPGNIIDDAIFTNSKSMTAKEIQTFLEKQMPTCDTYGKQIISGMTRAEYGKKYYGQSTFTCLRDYVENGKTSAQIIYDVSQTYKINPQVLLVLLQKEQSLVTDDWPIAGQYKSATGYGCPDTAPCDKQYFGLTNQLTWAGKMFRYIIDDNPNWYTPYNLGKNYIQYSPDASCGGTIVNIENRSTQALYNYTPYQPNQAVLNANWGATVKCGAYGNINFYMYFTKWFGATHIIPNFTALQDPRWMITKKDLKKTDIYTGTETGSIVKKDTVIFFPTKTTLYTTKAGCLRTEHDETNKLDTCILISDLAEITPVATAITPVLMRTIKTTSKYDPVRKKVVNNTTLENTKQITISGEITVGDRHYLITQDDMNAKSTFGIPDGDLSRDTAEYQSFQTTLMMATTDTSKIIPKEKTKIGSPIPKDTKIVANAKVLIDGIWYYRTEYDTAKALDLAIPESEVTEIAKFDSFDQPRYMQITKAGTKTTPIIGVSAEPKQKSDTLALGQQIIFTSKVTIDGKTYYRTKFDSDNDLNRGILSTLVSDIKYEKFQKPRQLKLKADTKKVSPARDLTSEELVKSNTKLYFTTKVIVNGIIYYRTDSDTKDKKDLAIPASALAEIK